MCMDVDEKTIQEIIHAVESDIPGLSKKMDRIHDLLVGTEEMPEIGLIPRVKAIEESLKDLGLLTQNLTAIPDLAKRLLELEITVLGVKRDGRGGLSLKVDEIKTKPEKQLGRIQKIIAVVGGSLGILGTLIAAIFFIAKLI